MCEIEHFVDPEDKKHPKFKQLENMELTLFSACNQLEEKGTEKVQKRSKIKRSIVKRKEFKIGS